MTTPENLLCLIVCSSPALLLWALVFRAMAAETVMLSVSPTGSIKFKVEGSRP